MATTEKYTAVVELNAQQAKEELERLIDLEKTLRQERDAIDRKKDPKRYAELTQQISAASKEAKKYGKEVMETINTMNQLSTASSKDIGNAIRQLESMMSKVPRDSDIYNGLEERLKEAKGELEGIKAVKAFEEVQKGLAGTDTGTKRLRAELELVNTTMNNLGTASVDQLKTALQVAERHVDSVERGTRSYERSAERVRVIKQTLEQAETEQQRTNNAINQYEQKLREIKKTKEEEAREEQLISETMARLSTANRQDLEYTVKVLEEQLRTQERGTQKYQETAEKVRQVREELRKVKEEQGEIGQQSQSWFAKIGDFFVRLQGVFYVFTSSFGFVKTKLQDFIRSFAEMEEVMADVRKYTGLTGDAVKDLNDDLKKMDTRTPRMEMNRLAGEAGRLGIQSKDKILEFVDAADKLNVALGDDLGDDAVKQVGKLAMAFGEDDRIGLRGAMLATGSAINELVQNSPASASYLVDFTARVAGFGKQLGLTQAQIMGFGAVMDENMLRDEMASTAFGNMLTKMQVDTEKFARIAGKSVEDFTKLLREDANEAVLQLAENLKRQDPTTMMKMLDDMGLDGARAVGVLSTLADKVGDVRERQKLANEAYRDATSIISEFNVMNETAQAKLDKARDKVNDLRVELGERLMPIVTNGLHLSSNVMETLLKLIEFTGKHATAVISLATAIAVATMAIKAKDIAEKVNLYTTKAMTLATQTLNGVMKTLRATLLVASAGWYRMTGNIKKCEAAMRAANIAAASNPWGAVIAVVAAVIGVFITLYTEINNLTDSTKRLKEATKEVNNSMVEEEMRLNDLVRVIKSAASSEQERRLALEELNGKLMQKHLGNITEEEIRLGRANKKLEEYLELRRKEITLAALEDQMKESIKSEEEAKLWFERISSGRLTWYEYIAKQAVNNLSVPFVGSIAGNISNEFSVYDKLVEMWSKAEQIHERQNQKFIKKAIEDITGPENPFANNGDGTPMVIHKPNDGHPSDNSQSTNTPYTPLKKDKKTTGEEKKKAAEAWEELRKQNEIVKAANDEALALNLLYYRTGERDYRVFMEEQRRITLEGLQKRQQLYGDAANEHKEIEGRALAEQKKLQLQEQELLLNGDQEYNEMRLRDMEQAHEKRKLELEAAYDDENRAVYHNADLLNEWLFQEDIDFLERKKKLYRKGSLERMEIEEQIEMQSLQHQQELRKQYLDRQAQYRQQFLISDLAEEERIAVNGLIAMYQHLSEQGRMSLEEYHEMLAGIQAEYRRKREEQARGQVEQAAADTTRAKRNSRVSSAVNEAKAKAIKENDTTAEESFVGDVTIFASTLEKLREMYKANELSYGEMVQGILEASAQMATGIASKMQAAFDAVAPLMSGLSSYYSAQQDYELAVTKKKYEKQIEAAGSNQKKVKKLQEKQAKEEAAIKTKYNKKAMKIQVAQALANTAVNAISAYGAVLQPGQPWTVPLAIIAAAAATAAGMLQVAAIKKQHQAEAAGYYEGGFTGGRQYRREAGVVHEGEFVASHQAVNNPNVLPFLNFLDQAQRNNTVGSLTAQDVSRALSAGSSSGGAIVAPVVNVQTDNAELAGTLAEARDVIARLNVQLDNGIPCFMDPERAQKSLDYQKRLKANK